MIKYIILILLMTIMGAFGGFFLKKASGSNSILGLLKNRFAYFGGISYILASILNIYVLRFLDYSLVLPLTAITYIWTMLISYFLLKEKIGWRKIAGVGFIIVGAVLLVTI